MKKIDWTKWSAVAEMVSSIAILITSIYLTIEIGQNSEAVHGWATGIAQRA